MFLLFFANNWINWAAGETPTDGWMPSVDVKHRSAHGGPGQAGDGAWGQLTLVKSIWGEDLKWGHRGIPWDTLNWASKSHMHIISYPDDRCWSYIHTCQCGFSQPSKPWVFTEHTFANGVTKQRENHAKQHIATWQCRYNVTCKQCSTFQSIPMHCDGVGACSEQWQLALGSNSLYRYLDICEVLCVPQVNSSTSPKSPAGNLRKLHLKVRFPCCL